MHFLMRIFCVLSLVTFSFTSLSACQSAQSVKSISATPDNNAHHVAAVVKTAENSTLISGVDAEHVKKKPKKSVKKRVSKNVKKTTKKVAKSHQQKRTSRIAPKKKSKKTSVIKKKKSQKTAVKKKKTIVKKNAGQANRSIKKKKDVTPQPQITKKAAPKSTAKAAAPAPQAASNTNAQFNGGVEGQIVGLVNAVRRQHGLQSLQVNGALVQFARQWSLQQYKNGKMSHGMLNFPAHSLGGQNVAYAMGDVNHFSWEQIWSAQATMNDWMNSPEHRANILNPNYRYIGVGVVYGQRNGGSDGWAFFTQDFAN